MSTVSFDTLTARDGTKSIAQALMHGASNKTWVTINAAGSSIDDDYGVSSLTDSGTGDCTANLTSNMANINYSVSGVCDYGTVHGGGATNWRLTPTMVTAAGSVRMVVGYGGTASNITLTDYKKNMTATGDLA
jgi:hypothetical protein